MKYYLAILFFLFSTILSGQQANPVKWTFSSKKINADSIEIHLTAIITQGWSIYSQNNDGGPGPTSFSFDKNPSLKLRGDVLSTSKPVRRYEKLFDAYVREFSSKVDFIQLAVRKDESPVVLTGKVKFMACNGKRCLPPKEEKFSIAIH